MARTFFEVKGYDRARRAVFETDGAVSFEYEKFALPGRMTRMARQTTNDRPLVDDLDRQLITLLQSNGRRSNTDMARELSVTETTVRNRVARLLDEGLINIVAVPTPRAVGMTLSAIIGISVALQHLSAVADVLAAYSEIRYVGLSTGRYDVIVEAFFTDHEHLLEFVSDKLGRLEGVTGAETSLILRVRKFSYEWEIP